MKNDAELVNQAYEFVAQGKFHWLACDLDGALENYLKALEILESKSKQFLTIDDLDVIADLGNIYREKNNYEMAIEYYKKAFGKDYLLIGDVYYENLKDYNKAHEIYLANSDIPSAVFNLSKMSWKGEGVPQSHINAFKWMNVAMSISPSNADFQNAFDELKIEMTASEIESAMLLTRKWMKERDEVILNNPWYNVGL